MITHFYKNKRYSGDRHSDYRSRWDSRNYKYKILCTNAYAFQTEGEDTGYTTVPLRVTCPICLQMVFERESAKYNKLKERVESLVPKDVPV